MTCLNPSTALARVLVDELARHGVVDAVLSPGSRSAPLAYALEEADRAGRVRLHVRVDERSAGFLALGLAKVSRRPVPVVTTSGTAVANLLPAVLEAAHAAVPLLVLTADRPPELRGAGANQTTDQVRVLGGAPRWFHELGAPEASPGQNATWRAVVGRAVAAATGLPSGDPGPVHLNLPLRDPLVPTDDAPDWPEPLEGRPHGRPWLQLRAPEGAADGGRPGIAPVPRTLAVLGDLPDPRTAAGFAALADAAGWPLVAEPFGRYHRGRVTPHGSLILSAGPWLEEHLPERVLVGGRPTLSRDVQRLLSHPRVAVELITPLAGWADPGHVVEQVHDWGAISRSHESVSACVDRAWAAAWRKGGAALARAVGPVVAGSWPSGPAVAATVAHHLPAGATLFVGSSNPVRDLDLGRNPAAVSRGVLAVGSRGLAGIDGVLSTAVGVALSRPDHPAFALVGDLTFLHDTNALLIGPDEPRPDLTVVVVNDDGGGIFGTLEPGREGLREPHERVFATPTGARLADLCAAHSVPHEVVTDPGRLRERVGDPQPGLSVVEVAAPRTGQRELRERLRRTAAQALAGDG